MGDLVWRRSSKIWRRGQEIGSSKVPQIYLCLQKESKWEDTNKKVMRSCGRSERRICVGKEEGVFIVKEGKERDVWVHWRTIEKGVY